MTKQEERTAQVEAAALLNRIFQPAELAAIYLACKSVDVIQEERGLPEVAGLKRMRHLIHVTVADQGKLQALVRAVGHEAQVSTDKILKASR